MSAVVQTTEKSSPSKVTLTSKELALACVKAAIDKKANHNLIYNVGVVGGFTEYFVIASGGNEKQVQAISDEIFATTTKAGSARPRIEGYSDGRWILIDFGSVVVHVFHDYIRDFYKLEELWTAAPKVSIPEEFFASPVRVS